MGSRILVVDDDPLAVESFDELLTRHGHSVVKASSGEAALAALEAEPPDLVLLEERLPGLSGYEICARIREGHGLAIPVLMLTALDDASSAQRCYDSGADDFIPTPVDHTTLLLKVRALLRTKSLHGELLRSQEESRARTRDMTLLHEIGRDWSLIAEPTAFYRLLTERLAYLIGAPICLLALYDPESRTLQAAVPACGLADDVTRKLRHADYHSLWSFESGRPYVSNHARTDRRLLPELMVPLEADSIVLVPMLSEGSPLGILVRSDR